MFTYLPEKKIKVSIPKPHSSNSKCFIDRSCDSTFIDTAINNRVSNVEKSILLCRTVLNANKVADKK